ncbi:MAG: hypothetical protein RR949_05470 [Oscillospiraceae bacterium]
MSRDRRRLLGMLALVFAVNIALILLFSYAGGGLHLPSFDLLFP